MITIISGTNRPNSNSKKVAKNYLNIIQSKHIETQLLALDEHIVFKKDADFELMESQYLFQADKYIIVVPEYNGSYSGILKLLIDNSDVAKAWHNKKVLLVGVSTGRAGNLRGLEHLTGSLLHMKMTVHPNRLPISSVHTLLNETDELNDVTLQAITTQIDEFLNF
jgi:chromate reductase, NAD(P)H dehydrogenase (quinone)